MAIQKANLQDTAFVQVHDDMIPMTEEQKERVKKVMQAYKNVLNGLEHGSSRELCRLDKRFKAKIEEMAKYPDRDIRASYPQLDKDKPLAERAAFLLADNAIVKIDKSRKNILGSSRESKQAVVFLLKDLGVKDDEIFLDLVSKKVPYPTEHKGGIIAVKEGNEYKTAEAVIFSRLYERYLQQLQTVLE